MTSFVNLLNSVEKLAYETIMWVIFIPKTIIKVITDPDWVPGYIEKELGEEKEERFTDYMSPVILLLTITLGMIAIIFSIKPSSLQISGPTRGGVDEIYEFEVKTIFMWENQEIVSYALYEYDDEKNEWMLFEYEKTSEIIQEDKWQSIEIEESNIKLDSVNDGEEQGEYIGEFRFEKEGVYTFAIEVVNAMGEIIWDEHSINISENTKHFQEPIPNESLPGSIEYDIFGLFTIEKGLIEKGLNEETALAISLLALSFPLVFTLFIEGKNNTQIDKKEFQPTFYIQCMYSSPVYLVLSLVIISIRYVTPGGVHAFGGIDLPFYFFFLVLLFWILISIWHLGVEIRYFSKKLFPSPVGKVKKMKATFMVLLLLIVYYSLLISTYIIFSENIENPSFYLPILLSLIIILGYLLARRKMKKKTSTEER